MALPPPPLSNWLDLSNLSDIPPLKFVKSFLQHLESGIGLGEPLDTSFWVDERKYEKMQPKDMVIVTIGNDKTKIKFML